VRHTRLVPIFFQAVMISDLDVQKQEMRVMDARRRLQQAMVCAENGDDDDWNQRRIFDIQHLMGYRSGSVVHNHYRLFIHGTQPWFIVLRYGARWQLLRFEYRIRSTITFNTYGAWYCVDICRVLFWLCILYKRVVLTFPLICVEHFIVTGVWLFVRITVKLVCKC